MNFTHFRRALLRPILAAAVPISYQTHVPPSGHGELDTPAVWVAPDPEQSLLLVTDKTQDWVEIHSATKNTYLGRLGGPGTGPGRLSRPNAVTVAYGVPTTAGPRDVMFVVERDNHRVSAYYLPYGLWLGSIGEAQLQEPMGIAVHWDGPQPQIWVTDIGTQPQRVVVFDVVPSPTGLTGVQRLAFNAPASSVLESIAVDVANNRVILSDEDSFDVMVFDMQGTFLQRFGTGRFLDDPEGIAIFDTGNGSGYLMVTDQVAMPRPGKCSIGRAWGSCCNGAGRRREPTALHWCSNRCRTFPRVPFSPCTEIAPCMHTIGVTSPPRPGCASVHHACRRRRSIPARAVRSCPSRRRSAAWEQCAIASTRRPRSRSPSTACEVPSSRASRAPRGLRGGTRSPGMGAIATASRSRPASTSCARVSAPRPLPTKSRCCASLSVGRDGRRRNTACPTRFAQRSRRMLLA